MIAFLLMKKRMQFGGDIIRLMGSVPFPWERENGGSNGDARRSNTELTETTIPKDELQRIRNVAQRMKERIKVGPAGVMEAIIVGISVKRITTLEN